MTNNHKKPSWRPVILTAAKGFCMGSADIIPGVSGGTMALILGIYERLLKAIRSFDKDWLTDLIRFRLSEALSRNDILFLAPLGFGILCAIMFFTRVIPLPTLILTHPELIYGLFFGLIAASVVVLMKEVNHYGPAQILIVFAGIVLGYTIVTLVPVERPGTLRGGELEARRPLFLLSRLSWKLAAPFSF